MAPRLTPRQTECLRLIADGFSIAETAAIMGISEQTAKNHLSDLYDRLGVRGHVTAFRFVGWLRPPKWSDLL